MASVELKTAPPAAGHNQPPTDQATAANRLRSIVERWERLEEEVKALRGDQKDIFAEAKSAGYDLKVLRLLIKRRGMERAEVEEQDSLLDTYEIALGLV
jgi:uncharacterized protein (UPF0335 family)